MMKYQQVNIYKKASFCLILLFLGLLSATVTHAETYTFVKKWGSCGSGDGCFSLPQGVAVDSADNVYVADIQNDRIQKFDSRGIFVTKWGSYGGGDGQFKSPGGIAVDSAGNVYIADTSNNRIQKFDSAGNFITYVGDKQSAANCSFGGGNGQFRNPVGVAVDSSDNVYVADTSNNRIQKFDSMGTFITKCGADNPGSDNGQFRNPMGVTVDSFDNVYVADSGNNRIQKFNSSDEFITKWGSYGSGDGQSIYPSGVAVDSSGNVYVADISDNRIQKFDSMGTFITKWGSYGSSNGQFRNPVGVAVDSSGNVYVADEGNNRIQKFATQTPSTPIADFTSNVTEGYAPISVQFTDLSEGVEEWNWDFGDGTNSTEQNPIHTYFAKGTYEVNLTVSNAKGTDSKVASINVHLAPTETYSFVTKWGSGGSGDGQFRSPQGVAVDSLDNVYVADYNNYRIQKFDSSGEFITKWGSLGSDDGQFNTPNYIAVDSSDNVYVTNCNDVDGFGNFYYNHWIQKFNSSGEFITKWGEEFNNVPADISLEPHGVAADSLGNVYVVACDCIYKLDSNFHWIGAWGGSGRGNGLFSYPNGVAVDSVGNVYVADTNNNRIQKFDSKGNFITKWGSYGSGDGQFYDPRGIAVDSSGNVYVADSDNDRIQKFDSNGEFIAKWGYRGTDDGLFSYPVGIAVDSLGNVYVADERINRIQKFAVQTAIVPVEPVANFTSNIDEGYAPLSVQFNDSSENAIAWTWDFGDGFNSTERNTTHTYSAAGEYIINLTVSNANGTDSKLATITVLEKHAPVLPVANFSTNVTDGYAPLAVQFNDSSENATEVSWDFENDGIPDSTEDDPVHVYAVLGTYTINLTASNKNGTNSKFATITVSSDVQVPEFPSIALPVAALLGLFAVVGHRKE